MSEKEHPKLRWPLEVQNHVLDGEQVVVLKCQQGIAAQPAVVPQALLAIVSRFDGTRSIAAIADEGAEVGVTEALVRSISEELDRLHFLDTAATRERAAQLLAEYQSATVREAALAGAVYPADRQVLTALLDDYISKTAATSFELEPDEQLVGLVCPHIDYNRGWQTYAAAYAALRGIKKPDVIFLLGTSHQHGESIFRLTKKAFETPLGTFESAEEIVDSLAAKYGEARSFGDEITHRIEHSLELQLPFLAHRFASEGLPKIVPILVGSMHQFAEADSSPVANEEVKVFCDALAEVSQQLEEQGKSYMYYCGVDFAHVGLNFGDVERVSDTGLEALEAADRELVRLVLEADSEKVFWHIAQDNDRRRICGYPSIYTMLQVLGQRGVSIRGEELEYRQAVDSETDTVVSFASLALITGAQSR